jgi:hypothetical protein
MATVIGRESGAKNDRKRPEPRRARVLPARLLPYTEEIAPRILQDDEIGVRAVPPGITGSAEGDQPLYFRALLVCIQVEVKPAPACRTILSRLKGEVGRPSDRIHGSG